jgi:DNA repair protein RecO (recombination protein O)
MEWTESAIILSNHPQGESSARVMVLAAEHGRHAGLVRGGRSPPRRAGLEPGTLVAARWRARLAEQLGLFTLEPLRSFGAALFDQPARLAALVSACALVEVGLPERAPHPALFRGLLALFEALEGPDWAEVTVGWEVGLLAELGYGLDLSRCAVTGSDQELIGVSPRTGRAVSRPAAGPWADRLLPLPGFLIGRGGGGPRDVAAGLALTGHFLAQALPGGLPLARVRLAEQAGRAAPRSGS